MLFRSILHHYNYCLKNNIFNSENVLGATSSLYYGIQEGIDNSDPNNYIRFNPISSSLPQYEDLNEPFLIERGDEIRVTYTARTGTTASVIISQDFTVKEVGLTDYASGSAGNNFRPWTNLNTAQTGAFIGTIGETNIRQFNKIFVDPDPSTLAIPIPNGEINQYTHRKRKNADNTINAISSPLEGSDGAATYSGGGYIIPNDLTETQKRDRKSVV